VRKRSGPGIKCQVSESERSEVESASVGGRSIEKKKLKLLEQSDAFNHKSSIKKPADPNNFGFLRKVDRRRKKIGR
jgi:hypothetical protein